MEAPDPHSHLVVSLIKSAVRIIGYFFLMSLGGWAVAAAIVLTLAEIIGIVEELV